MQKITFLLFLLLINYTINAQTSLIEMGTNPYSYNESETFQFIPTAFESAKTQFLFLNSELSNNNLTVGTEIVGIQWYVVTDNTNSNVTYDLFLDDDFVNNQLDATAVFGSITPLQVGNALSDNTQDLGWRTANFTTPFIWDGTDNLVLQMCRTSGALWTSDVIQLVNTNHSSYICGYYEHTCVSTQGDYAFNYRPYFRLIVTTSTLSSQNLDSKTEISVFPNPSNGIFKIKSNKNANLEIYDILGKQILTQNTSTGESNIDLSSCSSGIYFMKIISEEKEIKTLKIIKN